MFEMELRPFCIKPSISLICPTNHYPESASLPKIILWSIVPISENNRSDLYVSDASERRIQFNGVFYVNHVFNPIGPPYTRQGNLLIDVLGC